MRVLHTSDWHLGHRLHDHDRSQEHALFLEWLLNTIEKQRADALIVAGDIFDTANPTHQALQQYYSFLMNLKKTCCRHVIIIGGNHDSPGTLNAPREILKSLNIHVTGKAHESLNDEVLILKGKSGKPEGILCAVPFLRDRDIRQAIAGESYTEIEQRLKEGIIRRYQQVAAHALPLREGQVPVIATGHLFASGGELTDSLEGSEKPIHIGTLGNICADDFPSTFDYIALGHLHRPQKVSGRDNIRYAGAPVPLSFSEFSDQKSVFMLQFEGSNLAGVESLHVPCWRRLVRFRGPLDRITNDILTFEEQAGPMKVWAEIRAELDEYDPNFVQKMAELTKGRNLAVLKHQVLYPNRPQTLDELTPQRDLRDISAEEVFRRKCESEKFNLEGNPDILGAFRELLEELEAEG
jgi:exonuclease SbcD